MEVVAANNGVNWNWSQVYLDTKTGTIRLGQQPGPNWNANKECQSSFLNSQYGSGSAAFVSRFNLFSFTPEASGPSADPGEAVLPTIATEGAKFGVLFLLKAGGASSASLEAWSTSTLIPTAMGTAIDAQAKYLCRNVTAAKP